MRTWWTLGCITGALAITLLAISLGHPPGEVAVTAEGPTRSLDRALQTPGVPHRNALRSPVPSCGASPASPAVGMPPVTAETADCFRRFHMAAQRVVHSFAFEEYLVWSKVSTLETWLRTLSRTAGESPPRVVRNTALASADLLRGIWQSRLAEDSSVLRAVERANDAARRLHPERPIELQRKEIRRFFRASNDALELIAARIRAAKPAAIDPNRQVRL